MRKKERMPRDGRKIEKDCHAHHLVGDEGGGAVRNRRDREKEREQRVRTEIERG